MIAVVIRRSLDETPVFTREAAQHTVARMPIARLLHYHWRAVLRVVFAAVIATPSTIFTVWALSYAVNTVGLRKTPMLWVSMAANLVALLVIPAWARLSDRVGRKPLFIAGSAGSAVMTALYLWSITTNSYALIFVAGVAMFGVVYTATSAVWPAFYSEMFPATVRLSGTALGTQLGFAVAGFAPTIISATVGAGTHAWRGAAWITAGLCAVSIVAVLTGRETYRVPTAELGLPPGDRPAPAERTGGADYSTTSP